MKSSTPTFQNSPSQGETLLVAESYYQEKGQLDKLRLWQYPVGVSGGFAAFELSTLKQIAHILSDKSRLVKRTHLKRSQYQVVGKQHGTISETSQVKHKIYENWRKFQN